jgi:histidyl-tRNA synthetase
LWANGLNAETAYKEKSDPEGQTRYALENYFTYIVWIGESELDEGMVKVKHLESHEEKEIAADDLIAHLNSR